MSAPNVTVVSLDSTSTHNASSACVTCAVHVMSTVTRTMASVSVKEVTGAYSAICVSLDTTAFLTARPVSVIQMEANLNQGNLLETVLSPTQ